MKHFVTAYLIAYFSIGMPALLHARSTPEKSVITKTAKTETDSQTKVGDKAENLKIVPPWTMRLCPKVFHATYDLAGAKKLKKVDSACALWRTKTALLEAQTTDLSSVVQDLKAVAATDKALRQLDQKRIQDLIKQVNKEIAEKNEHKYKPNYGWLFVAVGSAIALTGLAFGAGVWLAKKD